MLLPRPVARCLHDIRRLDGFDSESLRATLFSQKHCACPLYYRNELHEVLCSTWLHGDRFKLQLNHRPSSFMRCSHCPLSMMALAWAAAQVPRIAWPQSSSCCI